MTSIAYSPESHQTSSHSVLSPPCWLGEVVLIVEHLRKLGVLSAISEQVRFARRRFGLYETIDFVAVLAGLRHQWGTNARSLLQGIAALGGTDHWHSSDARACQHAQPSRAF